MAYNSVSIIIDAAFTRANEVGEVAITREEVLTDYIVGFCNKVSELRTKWKVEEKSTHTQNTTTGGESFILPTDMKFADQRSIQAITVEGYAPLTYISVTDLRNKHAGLARATLNGLVAAGAATITVFTTEFLTESGTGYIAGDEFTWTGKTDTTLTGVSGVLDHTTGSTIYQSTSLDLPTDYTILEGVGYLYPAPSSDYSGLPLIIDYYKEMDRPTTEADTIPGQFVEACKDYCSMRVAQKAEKWTAADVFQKLSTSSIVQSIRSERIGERQYITVK